MNISENMKNAFCVVRNTYESIDKMMKHCDNIAKNNGYIPASDKFLRYKSDMSTEGWLINSFVKIYQNDKDIEIDNEWRNGPIFMIEINLYDSPKLNVAMFRYEDMERWHKGLSPGDHWGFYHPINTTLNDSYTENVELEGNVTVTKFNGKISNSYWGLQSVHYLSHDLTEITSDNISEFVFDNFDKLMAIGSQS